MRKTTTAALAAAAAAAALVAPTAAHANHDNGITTFQFCLDAPNGVKAELFASGDNAGNELHPDTDFADYGGANVSSGLLTSTGAVVCAGSVSIPGGGYLADVAQNAAQDFKFGGGSVFVAPGPAQLIGWKIDTDNQPGTYTINRPQAHFAAPDSDPTGTTQGAVRVTAIFKFPS